MSDTIAIIPAKATSERVPNKNLRLINELPLWYWSVAYALAEGVTPVVSTDSEIIINFCKQQNIAYVKEEVNDCKMSNCVKQVLDSYPDVKWCVLLQPTSPIRKPGQLYKMLEYSKESGRGCYTCIKVKPQGQILGAFRNAFRSQDLKSWIYAFDGSILIFSAEKIKEGEELITAESAVIEQDDLYNLQIDTELQYSIIKSICADNAAWLPYPCVKPIKKIAVISNKTDFKRNYSKTINSCDLVVRVNKMDGLYTGATGNKVDICVSGTWLRTLLHTPEERKDHILAQIPRVYFSADPVDQVSWREHRRQLNAPYNHLAEYPAVYYNKVSNWTSFGRAVWLVTHLFPAAELLILCDLNVVCRSGNKSAHLISSEVEWINKQSNIININEELLFDEPTGVYSVPLTEAEKQQVEKVTAANDAAIQRVTNTYNNISARLKAGENVKVGPYTWKFAEKQ